MRLLLPMAYIFLIVANKNSNVNSELATINENLTYRLMDFQPKKENGKQSDSMPVTASSANYDYSKHITPRRRSPRYQLHKANNLVDEIRVNNSEPVPPDQDRTLTNKNKDIALSEFEQEISQFRIAAGAPKRVKKHPSKKHQRQVPMPPPKPKFEKKKKKKPILEELDDVLKFDDDGDNDEEEETEEKKEKIRKVTIKKKKPRKNKSGTIRHQRQQPAHQLPYKTIIETENTWTRLRKPTTTGTGTSIGTGAGTGTSTGTGTGMYNFRTKPLILKENVETLNPNSHYDHTTVRKGVKPRDVNVFLRTRNTSPKIFIRRYKPYFSLIGLPVVHSQRPTVHKKRRKHKKKQRKRKKQRKHRDRNFFPIGSFAASQVSCSSERTPDVSKFGSSNSFPAFGSSPYEAIYDPYQPTYKPEPFSIADPFSDEYQKFPSESFSAIQLTTELPIMPIVNTEPIVAIDEPIRTGYDIHEHENTEALAALHEKETDDNLNNEEDDPQFVEEEANAAEDAEPEADDAADNGEAQAVEYENDEEESNPRWDLIFGYPQKPTQGDPNAGG